MSLSPVRDTRAKGSFEGKSGDGSYAATAKGCLVPPESDMQRRIPPGGFQKGHSSANTLILDFRFPELGKNTFVLFQATQRVVICYDNPKNNYSA